MGNKPPATFQFYIPSLAQLLGELHYLTFAECF